MSEKRQNNRNIPASEAQVGSEAPESAERRSEARMAPSEDERLARTEQMLEEVLDKENLKQAIHRVMQNKGAAGIDKMKVEELPAGSNS